MLKFRSPRFFRVRQFELLNSPPPTPPSRPLASRSSPSFHLSLDAPFPPASSSSFTLFLIPHQRGELFLPSARRCLSLPSRAHPRRCYQSALTLPKTPSRRPLFPIVVHGAHDRRVEHRSCETAWDIARRYATGRKARGYLFNANWKMLRPPSGVFHPSPFSSTSSHSSYPPFPDSHLAVGAC